MNDLLLTAPEADREYRKRQRQRKQILQSVVHATKRQLANGGLSRDEQSALQDRLANCYEAIAFLEQEIDKEEKQA